MRLKKSTWGPNDGLVTLAVDRGRLEVCGSTLSSKVESTTMERKRDSPCKVERKGEGSFSVEIQEKGNEVLR